MRFRKPPFRCDTLIKKIRQYIILAKGVQHQSRMLFFGNKILLLQCCTNEDLVPDTIMYNDSLGEEHEL
ncbi:hypothetical protein RO3G_10351 [Rhizopus delemar RA 99-880]|uniref:Uncharacterized protein n=1 Tax=Rhizopus delemar (strain RA 99-880 / ATCC MYA-4621 / FGSC 9543 / NRRL 43880) TaxID=246409 RepID=I1CB11_RHIO9|nr:hypothetical protein RO3G_10351 [Rhizopus delemar RA 99-880]|eukprot:EIE85641.1 hypothetical protein RO3G_10351 [Rhizopus delemar RA 99-880]